MRWLVLVAVLLLPAAPALAATPPAAGVRVTAPRVLARAAPLPAQSSTGTTGPAVTLGSMSPAVPAAGDTVTLSGTVTAGPDALTDLSVRLRSTVTRLPGRAAIPDVDLTGPLGRYSVTVYSAQSTVAPTVTPGATATWTVTVPVADLPLSSSGVYVLSAEVRARRGSRSLAAVGTASVLLPWQRPADRAGAPGRPARPTLQVVQVVPLVDRPHRDADGVFLDDSLAASVAPGGRLADLVAAGGGIGATWFVDPALLDDVAAMADGYSVRTASGGTAPGTGASLAASWLSSLRRAVGGDDVVATPYGDPDLVALHRAGFETEIAESVDRAVPAAEDVLQRTVRSDVVWPVLGQVDDGTLTALRADGVDAVVLDSGVAPVDPDVSYTPTGRVDLPLQSGDEPALLADGATDAAFLGADSTSPATVLAARQRLLAETLVTALERPTEVRTVLVAPPRRWRATAAAAALVRVAGQAPWTTAVPLRTLQAAIAPDVDRDLLDYPASARRAELPVARLVPMPELRHRLDVVSSVLARPEDLQQAAVRTLLTATSSAWRTDPGGAQALVGSVGARLDAVPAGVHVVPGPEVVLGGSEGTFAVTVANDLDQPVHLGLRVEPRTVGRLAVRQPGGFDVEPGRKTQVLVPVRALANGTAEVDLQLTTPRGDPLGGTAPLRVEATQYGTLAGLISAGAFGVLVVAAGVRIARRTRAARRASRAGGDGPGGHGPGTNEHGLREGPAEVREDLRA